MGCRGRFRWTCVSLYSVNRELTRAAVCLCPDSHSGVSRSTSFSCSTSPLRGSLHSAKTLSLFFLQVFGRCAKIRFPFSEQARLGEEKVAQRMHLFSLESLQDRTVFRWRAVGGSPCLCFTLFWKAPIPKGDPCAVSLCHSHHVPGIIGCDGQRKQRRHLSPWRGGRQSQRGGKDQTSPITNKMGGKLSPF